MMSGIDRHLRCKAYQAMAAMLLAFSAAMPAAAITVVNAMPEPVPAEAAMVAERPAAAPAKTPGPIEANIRPAIMIIASLAFSFMLLRRRSGAAND